MATCTIPINKQLASLAILSTPSQKAYITKSIIASLVSAFALAGNSQEGVIGSMLLAPLGGPILGLAMALAHAKFDEAGIATMFVLIGAVICILTGYGIGILFKNKESSVEMMKRHTKPDIWSFISAIIIGIAFGFVILSSDSVVEGAGAGIAISLLPPLVNVGMTFAKSGIDPSIKWTMMLNSTLIYLYNTIGMILGSGVLFAISCYFPDFHF
jgi:uncharacterized hydrophobic protein (TIGR00271 family)